jgi:hypothetical protein
VVGEFKSIILARRRNCKVVFERGLAQKASQQCAALADQPEAAWWWWVARG